MFTRLVGDQGPIIAKCQTLCFRNIFIRLISVLKSVMSLLSVLLKGCGVNLRVRYGGGWLVNKEGEVVSIFLSDGVFVVEGVVTACSSLSTVALQCIREFGKYCKLRHLRKRSSAKKACNGWTSVFAQKCGTWFSLSTLRKLALVRAARRVSFKLEPNEPKESQRNRKRRRRCPSKPIPEVTEWYLNGQVGPLPKSRRRRRRSYNLSDARYKALKLESELIWEKAVSHSRGRFSLSPVPTLVCV